MNEINITNVTSLFKKFWAPEIDVEPYASDDYYLYDVPSSQKMFGVVRGMTVGLELTYDEPLYREGVMPIVMLPKNSLIYNLCIRRNEYPTLVDLRIRLYTKRLGKNIWDWDQYYDLFRDEVSLDEYRTTSFSLGQGRYHGLKVPTSESMVALYNNGSHFVALQSNIFDFSIRFSGIT